MKLLVFALGVLGLAAIFGMSEPRPVSGEPVTSADVRLVSEKVSNREAGSVQNTKQFVHNYRRGSRFYP